MTVVLSALVDTFEQYLRECQREFQVPGVAAAIVTAFDVLHAGGYGLRDLASAAPVTPDTAFRVASITKACSAWMIATLVAEGRLAWDQPARELWPDFAMPTTELTAATRLSDLLSMRTGLQNTEPTLILYGADATPESTLETLSAIPVAAPFGSTFIYQDQAYSAAGYLATLVNGATLGDLNADFAALLRERVFEPLGMVTAMVADDPAAVGPDAATPHALDLSGAVVPVGYVIPLAGYVPAGGVVATVMDLARLIVAQLRGPAGPEQAVPRAAHTDMGAVVKGMFPYATSGAYGMGWVRATLEGGGTVIGHNGGIDGFSSEMAFWPELGVGLVLLNNLEPAHGGVLFNMAMRDTFWELATGREPVIARRLAAAHAGLRERLLASAPAARTPDRGAVAPYLGSYARGWSLSWREDAASPLWLVRPHRQLPLDALADGGFVVRAGPLLGARVAVTGAGLELADGRGDLLDTLPRES